MPDTTSLIDHPGMDSWLARLLHEQGCVELPVLQDLLAQVRGLRASSGVTLARLVVERGLLPTHELESLMSGITRSSTGGGVTTLAPGALLGRYRIGSRLGAGGMGTVFRAEDEETGGVVAVKVIPLNADPELLLRFRREGEAQARVDRHPNVVRVHAAGSTEQQAYLVMDLAGGGSLEERLRRGPLPVREAVELTRDLARGLGHVHAQGVLHRDLKPANVLFDERGVPKLVDFGLAQVSGADRLTQTGAILGTPAYMAPEQADSSSGPVDARTDVYGLGALLYEALTGRAPFVASSVMGLLVKVVQENPAAPSSLRAEIPPEVDAVCLRCLAKDPNARPASADALVTELEAALSGAPVAQIDPCPSWLPIVTLLVGLLIGASFGGVFETEPSNTARQADPISQPEPKPETVLAPSAKECLEKAMEERDANRQEAALRWLELALAQDPGHTLAEGANLAPLLLAAAEAELSELRATSRPECEAVTRVRRRLVVFRLMSPRAPIASKTLDSLHQLGLRGDATQRDAARPGSTRMWKGLDEFQLLMKKALAEQRVLDLRCDYPATWPGHWEAWLRYLNNLPNDAIRASMFEVALLWHPELSILWLRLGRTYWQMGRHHRSLRCLRTALMLDPESGLVQFRLAEVLFDLGRLDRAQAVLERARPAMEDRKVRNVDGNLRHFLLLFARTLHARGESEAAMDVISEIHRRWNRRLSEWSQYWFLRSELLRVVKKDPEGSKRALGHGMRRVLALPGRKKDKKTRRKKKP